MKLFGGVRRAVRYGDNSQCYGNNTSELTADVRTATVRSLDYKQCVNGMKC